MISRRTRSGWCSLASLIPSRPFSALSTLNPSILRLYSIRSRRSCSSSTTRIVCSDKIQISFDVPAIPVPEALFRAAGTLFRAAQEKHDPPVMPSATCYEPFIRKRKRWVLTNHYADGAVSSCNAELSPSGRAELLPATPGQDTGSHQDRQSGHDMFP